MARALNHELFCLWGRYGLIDGICFSACSAQFLQRVWLHRYHQEAPPIERRGGPDWRERRMILSGPGAQVAGNGMFVIGFGRRAGSSGWNDWCGSGLSKPVTELMHSKVEV